MEGCGSQPAANGGWQNLTFPGGGMDAEVPCQPCGHHLMVAVEVVANLKACGIQLLAVQVNDQAVAVAHGPLVLGLAVNDGQGCMGIGEDVFCGHAKGGQGVFIGLMAPAQQVMKMHDAGWIGFPKPDSTTDH